MTAYGSNGQPLANFSASIMADEEAGGHFDFDCHFGACVTDADGEIWVGYHSASPLPADGGIDFITASAGSEEATTS